MSHRLPAIAQHKINCLVVCFEGYLIVTPGRLSTLHLEQWMNAHPVSSGAAPGASTYARTVTMEGEPFSASMSAIRGTRIPTLVQQVRQPNPRQVGARGLWGKGGRLYGWE